MIKLKRELHEAGRQYFDEIKISTKFIVSEHFITYYLVDSPDGYSDLDANKRSFNRRHLSNCTFKTIYDLRWYLF